MKQQNKQVADDDEFAELLEDDSDDEELEELEDEELPKAPRKLSPELAKKLRTQEKVVKQQP